MSFIYPRNFASVGVLVIALLSASCTDTISTPPTGGISTSEAVSGSAEAEALEIGRALASALKDQGLRSRLSDDLSSLGVTEEKKLELSTYLSGQNGGLLATKIGAATGASREEVLSRVAALPPLELYMPVPSHREAWHGGEDLLVAVHLDEEAEPIGFDLDGRMTVLDLEVAPETPTLVLVPAETNFNRTEAIAMEPSAGKDGFARFASSSISPAMVMQSYPPGIYFNYMRIHDDNEPWTKGSPEIEVHLAGYRRGVVNVVDTQPGVYLCGGTLPCIRPGYDTDPTAAALMNQRWLFYQPTWMTRRFVDCAGAQESGIRSFNFEGTGHWNELTLFGEESQFVVSEFIAENGSAFGTRQIPVEPPFEVAILERDDGEECPTDGYEKKIIHNVLLSAIGGAFNSFSTVDVKNPTSFSWMWGGGNDVVARWIIGSYASLEAASNLYLDESDSIQGDDADLQILNIGFAQSHLPPWQQYYPPVTP